MAIIIKIEIAVDHQHKMEELYKRIIIFGSGKANMKGLMNLEQISNTIIFHRRST